MAPIRLFRGDSATEPSLGKHSYWCDNELHASKFAGFHLPATEELALYRANITPVRLLDLRTSDPWLTLYEETEIDLREKGGQRQDLLHAQLEGLTAIGFDWVARFADYAVNDGPHRAGGLEEWIYLGDGEVRAIVIRTLPNEWQ